jgi:hypothetical protein
VTFGMLDPKPLPAIVIAVPWEFSVMSTMKGKNDPELSGP